LFWKKKNPETDIIESASRDKRESFRYHFKKDKQLQILFKKQPVKVINISAGGMSFSDIGFQQFDVDSIQFSLDVPNYKGFPLFLWNWLCIFSCSLEQLPDDHIAVLPEIRAWPSEYQIFWLHNLPLILRSFLNFQRR